MEAQATLDIMLDVETLSTREDGVIFEGALVVFERETGVILEEFRVDHDILEELVSGYRVDDEVQDFWVRHDQRKEYFVSRTMVCSVSSDISDVLVDMLRKYKIHTIWTRRGLDAKMMMYRKPDLPYWKFRDTSSFDILLKFDGRKTHDPLQDCHDQVYHVTQVVAAWNARGKE